mgnify:CR=1 FL=1
MHSNRQKQCKKDEAELAIWERERVDAVSVRNERLGAECSEDDGDDDECRARLWLFSQLVLRTTYSDISNAKSRREWCNGGGSGHLKRVTLRTHHHHQLYILTVATITIIIINFCCCSSALLALSDNYCQLSIYNLSSLSFALIARRMISGDLCEPALFWLTDLLTDLNFFGKNSCESANASASSASRERGSIAVRMCSYCSQSTLFRHQLSIPDGKTAKNSSSSMKLTSVIYHHHHFQAESKQLGYIICTCCCFCRLHCLTYFSWSSSSSSSSGKLCHQPKWAITERAAEKKVVLAT